MCKQVAIRLRVVSIRPGAVYQGEVYDQDVDLEVDKVRFTVFDGEMLAQPHHLGKVCNLRLFCLFGKNYLQNFPEKGIRVEHDLPMTGKMGDEIMAAQRHPTLYGEVLEVDLQRESYVLDVGYGTVECDDVQLYDPVEQVPIPGRQVQKGEFVIHRSRRIDLRAIEA